MSHMKTPIKEGKPGLRCKCGYGSSRDVAKRQKQELRWSFCVINIQQHLAFLGKMLRARGVKAKMQAIRESSRHLGCLTKCPKCSRLLLRMPGGAYVCYAPNKSLR